MNGSWHYMMDDWALRQQDLARRMAERETYARSRHKSSLRARVALALRAGGSRRAGGDLAPGLGEAGSEGPVVRPAPSRGK